MRFERISLATTLLALSLVGCSGKGGSTSVASYQAAIIAALTNTAGASTILEAQLLFDGAVAVDDTSTTAVSVASLNASGTIVAGSHSLGFLIVSQTATPTGYTVLKPEIQIRDATGALVKDIVLTTQQASLATGQTISYSFSF